MMKKASGVGVVNLAASKASAAAKEEAAKEEEVCLVDL